MKVRTRNPRFGFLLAAILALLSAIVAAGYGFSQMEYNHAAAFFVALGGVLLALAFTCAWFAWASSTIDSRLIAERSRRD